jgi:hypothetical protein
MQILMLLTYFSGHSQLNIILQTHRDGVTLDNRVSHQPFIIVVFIVEGYLVAILTSFSWFFSVCLGKCWDSSS